MDEISGVGEGHCVEDFGGSFYDRVGEEVSEVVWHKRCVLGGFGVHSSASVDRDRDLEGGGAGFR